jgi:hypothetical protein
MITWSTEEESETIVWPYASFFSTISVNSNPGHAGKPTVGCPERLSNLQ